MCQCYISKKCLQSAALLLLIAELKNCQCVAVTDPCDMGIFSKWGTELVKWELLCHFLNPEIYLSSVFPIKMHQNIVKHFLKCFNLSNIVKHSQCQWQTWLTLHLWPSVLRLEWLLRMWEFVQWLRRFACFWLYSWYNNADVYYVSNHSDMGILSI